MGFREEQLSSGFVAGIVMIVLGVGLFLANLGIVPFRIQALLALGFILWGGLALLRAHSLPSAVYPVTALVAGAILIFTRVSVWSLWPLLLIASGVLAMLSGLRLKHFTSKFTAGSTLTRLQETAIFSGAKRRVETANFEGGDLSCLFGGIEVDLRRASMAEGAVIEANAFFGGIEVRVPEEWVVVVQGFAMFGAYEDKTLPPRPEPGLVPPVLTIRGNTAFGGVSIKN